MERGDEAGDTLMYVPLNGDNPSIKEGLIFKRSAGGKYFGHFKRVTRMDTKEETKHRVEFYNLQGELESWSDIPEGRGRQQEIEKKRIENVITTERKNGNKDCN